MLQQYMTTICSCFMTAKSWLESNILLSFWMPDTGGKCAFSEVFYGCRSWNWWGFVCIEKSFFFQTSIVHHLLCLIPSTSWNQSCIISEGVFESPAGSDKHLLLMFPQSPQACLLCQCSLIFWPCALWTFPPSQDEVMRWWGWKAVETEWM